MSDRIDQIEDSEELEIVVGEPPVEEPGEFDGVTRDELIKRLQESDKKVGELATRVDQVSALSQGIAGLGDKLARPEPPPVAPREPGESEEEFAKRVREGIIDDPYKIMTDFHIRKLQPALQRLAINNLTYSKKFAKIDAETKTFMERYGDEVDQEVRGLSDYEKTSDPDVYKSAALRVGARHVHEIINERVAEGLKAKEVQEAKPGNYYEGGGTRPPEKKKRVGYLTPEEKLDASTHGMTEEIYWRVKNNEWG